MFGTVEKRCALLVRYKRQGHGENTTILDGVPRISERSAIRLRGKQLRAAIHGRRDEWHMMMTLLPIVCFVSVRDQHTKHTEKQMIEEQPYGEVGNDDDDDDSGSFRLLLFCWSSPCVLGLYSKISRSGEVKTVLCV